MEQLLIKVCLLALYLRVFRSRWLRITAIAGIIEMTVQDFAYWFAIVFQCSPIRRTWDIRTPGSCFDLNTIGTSGAVFNIVEHFIILLLPLPELWKLKLSRRKRVQLAMVFGIGSL